MNSLSSYLEALIFATDHPLNLSELQRITTVVLDREVDLEEIQQEINRMKKKFEESEMAFTILKTGGGFQFVTKPEFHSVVSHLNGDKYNKKLSATSMETLSIIAYKQPVTKTEIEFIRGVSADYAIQKLLEKELIQITGRKEEAVGKPLLYGTTPFFMDYLGINEVSDLPMLKEISTLNKIEPTKGEEAVVDHQSEN